MLHRGPEVGGVCAWIVCVLACGPTAAADGGPITPIPTFSRDVAPIVYAECASCHHPEGAAPFPLLSYDDVRKRALQVVDVVRSGFMPPWLPEAGYGRFADERRLTRDEIDILADWAQGGTPEGDPAQLPPVPSWKGGWQLGEPDLVITMDRSYVVPADGPDVFRNFVMPIPGDTIRYVRTIELHPGNPRVVHHADMRTDETRSSRRQASLDPEMGFGDMNMGDAKAPDGYNLTWTPGHMPDPGRDGYAWTLRPDTEFVLQMHMQPSGKPEPIQAKVGFYFADEPPEDVQAVVVLRARDIDIPAGEADYTQSDAYRLPVAVEVLQIYPHAHYLGKRFKVWAERPDGSAEDLLRIDDWDFNWQDAYRYEQPVRLPAGTTVRLEIVFDNSSANPRNPNVPPARVRSGSRAVDEMGTLTLQLLPGGQANLESLFDALTRQDVEKDPNDFLARYNLAITEQKAGRLDEAAVHYRKTLELNPRRAGAYNNLALIAEEQGRTDEAAQLLRRALEINPGYAEAHHNLGRLLQNGGNTQEAEQQYRAALELNPGDAASHFNLARIELQAFRFDEAFTHLQAAQRLNPDDPAIYAALGDVHARGQEFRPAVANYRRALELAPNMVAAHANLAGVLAHLVQVDEAIEHYRRALALDPSLESTRTSLDRLITMKAEIDQAIAAAKQQVAAAGGRDVGALMTLADTYASAGKIEDALETAREALKLTESVGLDAFSQRIRKRIELYRTMAP